MPLTSCLFFLYLHTMIPLTLHLITLWLSVSTPATPEIDLDARLTQPFTEAGYQGVTLLYDENEDRYTSNDPDMAEERFVPASTFKIFNALTALETGVAKDVNHLFKWDGTSRRIKAWERDLTLEEAFRVSCLPCFQELARAIGETRMKHWLKTVDYGNRSTADAIDSFWLTGKLRISPLEQVQFINRLVNDELPYATKHQQSVRDMMFLAEQGESKLYGKTGWADGYINYGWLVGWVEKPSGKVMYATLIYTQEPAPESFPTARRAITEQALRLTDHWTD